MIRSHLGSSLKLAPVPSCHRATFHLPVGLGGGRCTDVGLGSGLDLDADADLDVDADRDLDVVLGSGFGLDAGLDAGDGR